MKPSAPRGGADSTRLAVAALLAVLLHLALAQVPITWRPSAAPPAAPIQISLLPRPAAPPAVAPGPATPPAAAAPLVETAPEQVEQAVPIKPESRPEPPPPRRAVVTAKVSKPREPVRPVARSKPVKPKPFKPKPVKPARPVEPTPEPPIRITASPSSPAPSSPAGGGGPAGAPAGGASASTAATGAPAAGEAKLRPLPGNPPPRYPSLARRRGEEGRVLLQLTVNAAGRVDAVSVARSSGHELLDQAAQRTVARWRFQPPREERMVAQVPITFRLRD